MKPFALLNASIFLMSCSQFSEPQGLSNSTNQKLILEPAVLNYTFIRTEILEKKCIECHKADGKADELIFGNRDEMLNLRTDAGLPLIVPGKPEQSLMYLSLIKDETIRQDTRLMPPKKAVAAGKIKDITPQEVELIKKWIAEGAQ